MSYDVKPPPTREERALRIVEQLVVVRESGNIPNDEWRGLWKQAFALVEEVRAERKKAKP